MKLRICAALTVLVITGTACSGSDDDPPSPSPTASTTAIAPSTTSVAATPTPAASPDEPAGYPLDPQQPTDAVVGEPGARTFDPGEGASVRDTSIEWQPLDVPARANQFGWNCRVHVEYEAAPAVDWYVPAGTPVKATMDGTATLFINTYVNAFDYYAVDREPYIGNPDRARAPIVPFSGPGGGMGVYVSIEGDAYRTDYGHLDLAPTLANVPSDAFEGGYSSTVEVFASFAAPRTIDAIVATWPVRRGDVIGYTGDAGYSEAPHLHYQIIRLTDGAQLCPTSEAGFADGGWLER